MDEKFNRRFTSFCNSLDALSEAKNRDFSDSFVLSGTSAKFSITFDLAWKVMKDICSTMQSRGLLLVLQEKCCERHSKQI